MFFWYESNKCSSKYEMNVLDLVSTHDLFHSVKLLSIHRPLRSISIILSRSISLWLLPHPQTSHERHQLSPPCTQITASSWNSSGYCSSSDTNTSFFPSYLSIRLPPPSIDMDPRTWKTTYSVWMDDMIQGYRPGPLTGWRIILVTRADSAFSCRIIL